MTSRNRSTAGPEISCYFHHATAAASAFFDIRDRQTVVACPA
jgi:hypothetical protein